VVRFAEDPEARRHAAGFIGFAIGGPLSDGLTPWIAAPLLFIGAMFGLLLLTGTTIREVPDAMRAMFGTRLFQRDYADDDEYDAYYGDGEEAMTLRAKTSPTVITNDASFGPEHQPPAWPSADAVEIPLEETPTVPEPAAAPGRRRASRKEDTQALDRVVEGPYTLRR